MKQKITLLSFVFFMVLFSFGQRKESNDNRYYEKSRIESQIKNLNRGKNIFSKGPLFIKSRGVFQNSRVNSFQSISSPLVIKYRLDYEVRKFWDETTNQLVNDAKTEYTFDDKGFLNQEMHSHWEDSQWNVGWKVEYSNDTNGNLIQQINSYYWENQWEPELKQEYTYDTNENLIQHIEYLWRPSTNQWDNMWKTEFTYDTMGNLIQEIYYMRSSNQWVNEEKSEYTYDTNGNLIQDIDYNWSASQWINNRKTEYTYDTNEILIQDIDYNWSSSQWINNRKTEYSYDSNWNLTQILDYLWGGSQWYNNIKTENTYETNNNLTQNIRYRWNGSQWINEFKADYTYNNLYSFSDLILPYFYSNTIFNIIFNHMLTNSIRHNWDSSINEWVITNNFDFYYSEYILSVSEIIEDQLKIYPNPTSNILTIKSDIIPIDKVEIYSVLGKKIKEIKLDFNNIYTEDLSKGIYLLKIFSEKGTVVKKLIKK